MTTTEFTPDLELYERLSEPIAQKDAESRIWEFLEGVRQLRVKHGIPEVICSASINTTDGDAECAVLHYGDARKSIYLADAVRREILTLLVKDEVEKILDKNS